MSRSAWPWFLAGGAVIGAGALVLTRRPHWIGLVPKSPTPPTAGAGTVPPLAAPAPAAKPSPLAAIPAAAPPPPAVAPSPPAGKPAARTPHAPTSTPAPTASPASNAGELPRGFKAPPGATAERGLETLGAHGGESTSIHDSGGPEPPAPTPDEWSKPPDNAG